MRTRARVNPSLFRQRGGFFTGVIVGLLIGLALALGVALYVTKVPVPFLDKVPQRTEEQDAAEREKNKNWDPNAPLAGKNPAKPASAAAAASAPASTYTTVARDPASILADRPVPGAAASSKSPAPLSTGSAEEAFSYFVQTGAYASAEDAESQRGKLALLGYAARVTEREQSGRTVHRVRLGPFDEKVEADSTKEKLVAAGLEAVLVRAPK
ncbi:MAG: SPOR domain-containing protein [Rhizobacter sp.]